MPTGFGIDRMVPEQAAALRALGVIGGREAAQAVSRLIVRGVEWELPRIADSQETEHRAGSALY
jgi:hypothetical protein